MHRLTTAPTALPVTVAECKRYSNVTIDDDDTLIEDLVRESVAVIENRYGLACMEQTWTLTMNGWNDSLYWRDSAIHITRPPFGTVTAITYLDSAGDSQTLAAAKYRVDAAPLAATVSVAKGQTWPTTYGVTADVTIVHTCGNATAAAVPYVAKAAVRDFVDYRYNTRGQGFQDVNSIIARGILSQLDSVMAGEGLLLYG